MIPLGVLGASRHVASGGSYDTVVMADSPVAYWRFDDTLGTDISGSGYTATLVNSPTNTTSPTGTGLSFNGSNQYASGTLVPAFNAGLATDTWTVEMLIKVPLGYTEGRAVLGTVDAGTSELILLTINSGTTGDYLTSSGQTGLHIRTASGGQPARWVTVAGALPYDGEWHHLAFAGPRSPVVCYVDGAPASMASAPTTQAPNHDGFGYPLAIGAVNTRGAITNYAPVSVSEFALYGTNLGPATIAAHAAAAGF